MEDHYTDVGQGLPANFDFSSETLPDYGFLSVGEQLFDLDIDLDFPAHSFRGSTDTSSAPISPTPQHWNHLAASCTIPESYPTRDDDTHVQPCPFVSDTTSEKAKKSARGSNPGSGAKGRKPQSPLRATTPPTSPPKPSSTRQRVSKRSTATKRKAAANPASTTTTTPTPRAAKSTAQPPTTKSPDPEDYPTLDEYKENMRQWHNRIGRKYRIKLNDQFESLQAVLLRAERGGVGGTDRDGEEGEIDGTGKQQQKKRSVASGRTINKGKVLDMARRRIEDLQSEKETLRAEKEVLLRRLGSGGYQI
ncbi:hypothetical protein B0T17DRAFT_541433 [Bombardia bombarda]|uniref:BHLH domain-containing protein n=1 Tax=Bombardia bombarda TaxID=252184 RepID=A0AA39WH04_9PEZI|nr:hypothetical protein B0T17DRAFT_541433 [Bombardia bombarda]